MDNNKRACITEGCINDAAKNRVACNQCETDDALDVKLEVMQSNAGRYGNALARICHHAAASSGWWTDTETGEDVRNWPAKYLKLWIGTKIALMHSELSEGLEGHRKGQMDDHLPHRPMFEVELADAVIRIMDLAGGLGMDIGGAIAEKLAYNAQRADHKIENRNTQGGKAY